MFVKRLLDLIFSFVFFLIFGWILIIISILIKISSKGPAIYWSKRVGINNNIFLMPKFRSMKINTPQVATDLLTNPDQYLTSVGRFIRKTSLDEIPQIYSVLKGDMSIVGPRPALFNEDLLIQRRTEKRIHLLKPGITGWAQINGRDNIKLDEKVKLDEYYLNHRSLKLDLYIILKTASKVVTADGVQH